jgi:3-phenylpropionate/trans-cinnamate dioxygenase ferredoxin reductase subunit
MARRKRVVVVGGGQAGGRLTQLLAQEGDKFDVTLVCREAHPPYERPPLSKGVLLGSRRFDQCLIWADHDNAWNAVDLRLGTSAETIDRNARTVCLSDGATIGYDILVLATGSNLRRVSVPGHALAGVHSLRCIDDALRIGNEFAEGKHLVVVGGGFIGLEIAASASTCKLATTVVEASDRLLARVVPPHIAGMLARRHESEGVALRMGTMVEEFISNGRGAVHWVKLSSGELLRCDIAVVGVGVRPETGLAAACGLDVDVGICVDASLRTSDPAVFACGDAATFFHPLYGRHVRVEAWQNAENHARVIASVLNGEEAVCDTVPWFWSDQYELSLQITGLPSAGSSIVTRTLPDGAVVLFHLDPAGRLIGATGFGIADSIGRDVRLAQALIAARAHPSRQALRDPTVRLKAILEGAKRADGGSPAALSSSPPAGLN